MSPFKRLVNLLKEESLLVYDNPKDLFDKRDEVWERLAALTKMWTTRDIIAAMLAVYIWCGEVKTHLQAAEDPQVKHLGAIAAYEHPKAGTVKIVAPAVKFSKTPAEINRPAPLVGEHSREILREFGFTLSQIDGWLADGSVGLTAASSSRDGQG